MAKVSVIIPVYNGEQVIGRCLDSILKQEFTDLEVIPVNDGSKDLTKKILDEYAEKDPRVKPIHKENGGVSSARNAALDQAQGEYIQFLDADDWITKDSTKMLVRRMEESRSDLVIADFYRVSGDHISQKGEIDTQETMTRNQFAEHMMENPANFYYGVLWNKLYRRSIIEKYHLRMDEAVHFSEDFLFNLEYFLHCDFVSALQVPVYYYVKTEGSLVSKNMDIAKLVEMKINMFQYYDRFYRNIYDEETYRAERLNIASYLISFATDNPAFGLNMSRLGKENTLIQTNLGLESNVVTTLWYTHQLYEHYLQNVALQFDLELKSVKAVSYLMMSNAPVPMKELSQYMGAPYPVAIALMQKLVVKKYIKMDYLDINLPVSLTTEAGNIVREIHNAMVDLENSAFQGMQEEEKEKAVKTILQISENLKRTMQVEDGKENA